METIFYSPTKGSFYSPSLHPTYFIEVTVEDGGQNLIVDPNGPISDGVEVTEVERQALLRAENEGKVIGFDQVSGKPVAKDRVLTSPDEVISHFTSVIQERLDGFAKSRGYDSVNSAAKYKDISDEDLSDLQENIRENIVKFRSEARYLALKTAETWARCYLILAEFQINGVIPTEYEVLNQLPVLEWPT